jgi:hypothetical protein
LLRRSNWHSKETGIKVNNFVRRSISSFRCAPSA